MSAQTKRAWRNRLIFVVVVAATITGYIIYINSNVIFNADELVAQATRNFGVSQAFSPNRDSSNVPGMVRVAQTDSIALYIEEETTKIAVLDLRNNHVWYSTPVNFAADSIANPFEEGTMRSHVGFRYLNEHRLQRFQWLFPGSIENGQFEIFSIPNGVRIEYIIGDLDPGINRLPPYIEQTYFQERVLDRIEVFADQLWVRNAWRNIDDDYPDFFKMSPDVGSFPIHRDRMLSIFFDDLGWTEEETIEQNNLSGIEIDDENEVFNLTLEFVIEDDRLIANLPLSEFTTNKNATPFEFDFMKFFGAGDMQEEGFILVPSGAGGVIRFNNGKFRETPFRGAAYGDDYLMNIVRPQVSQPVRLPVFGIQNETAGAAFIAQVQSGAALASVNADVAGRVNSYNHAWFSFTLRTRTELSMAGIGGGGSDLIVAQDKIFPGNITVMYHFVAGENPGISEMADTYRNYLVKSGVLTPISGAGNRSFYMDVIGAIDVQRHIMGTPYMTTETMTTLEDAQRFANMFNENGNIPVQMQLHGWFNRGVNHDAAKRVRRIRDVGSRQEMINLNNSLESSGGGLYPAVNFQMTNYDSRRFNRNFESVKDLGGYVGFMARHTMRDSLTIRFSAHANDWYLLVHPGMLPFHIDDFIPEYQSKTAIDNLGLTDLGDMINESLFRRDSVDRETARLIVREQLRRLNNNIGHLLISGGNDFALEFASHIVDAPIQTDMQYIIDYEVPFFPMIVHGFLEFAGAPANMREDYSATHVLLTSMATGASPRYILTQAPTRNAQFSPYERYYSTQYENWMDIAKEHYRIFNEVYAPLRAENITNFEILAGSRNYVGGKQVTVTEFSNGTRIYVNNTTIDFDTGDFVIPAEWFVVR